MQRNKGLVSNRRNPCLSFSIYVISITVSAFLFSCQVSPSKKITSIQVTGEMLNPDHLVKDTAYPAFRLIPLETKKECFIASIEKVIYFNHEYYLLNTSQTNNLLVFSDSGMFKRQISQPGGGPMECKLLDKMSNGYKTWN